MSALGVLGEPTAASMSHLDLCRVYLPAFGETGTADWRAAKDVIRPLAGNVALEQDAPSFSRGAILLPESAASHLRSDAYTVLAVGPGVPLEPGQRVAALPWEGKRFRRWAAGGYVSASRVVMIGPAASNEYEPCRRLWHEVIVASLDGNVVRPTADWVLIRRLPADEDSGGIVLPDDARYRRQVAVVVATGPDAKSVEPGDTVVYHAKAQVVGFAGAASGWFPGDPRDYTLVRQSQIHCVVEV